MTIQSFLQLCKSEQLQYVGYYGVKLANRPFGGDRFDVFRAENFYVEVLTRFSSANEIHGTLITRVTTDDDILEPYLRFIDIESITAVLKKTHSGN